MAKRKFVEVDLEVGINKRVNTCHKILKPILGNDLSNVITNMLPTEKDRFYEKYYKYVDDYGANNIHLISLYKCGCFTLNVCSIYLYSGGDNFYLKCELHESEIKKCENEIEQLKKECAEECRKRNNNLSNILKSREALPDELFYNIS